MALVLSFGVTLLAAVLVSALAHRTILSTAVLFLAAGFVIGQGGLSVVDIEAEDEIVSAVAEVALVSVLFTDGMRAGSRDVRSAWRLPGRTLLFGLPLTLLITAALARYVAGLPWIESLLLGAALSPTDPVLAAAIVGRDEVPRRLRHLLNVESGLNDGIALPIVIILLAAAGARENASPLTLAAEVAGGVVVGIAIPAAAILAERTRFLSASTRYQPLFAFAIGLTVYGLASVTGANAFLAAFASGATVATMAPEARRAFERFGELFAELVKFAALLVFGALISVSFLADISLGGYAFALLALLVARPTALGLSLLGSRLPLAEWLAVAWFGPKGFASVVYGLLILDARIDFSDELFHLAALVVAASIVAHSSTDALVAQWFERAEAEAQRDEKRLGTQATDGAPSRELRRGPDDPQRACPDGE